MDQQYYAIRRELSLALAAVGEARAMYPDAPLVTAVDALQDVVSRLTDIVETLEKDTRGRLRYVDVQPSVREEHHLAHGDDHAAEPAPRRRRWRKD